MKSTRTDIIVIIICCYCCIQHNLKHHTAGIVRAKWNPICKDILATASADTTIDVWDLSKKEEVCFLQQNLQAKDISHYH